MTRMGNNPGSSGPKSHSKATVIVALVLTAGCLWNKEHQIIYAVIRVANEGGDKPAVDAWAQCGQQIVGQPPPGTPMPSATVTGAAYYLSIIKVKQAKLMAWAAGLGRAIGLRGLVEGGGILAGLFALWRSRKQIGALASRAVTLGKDRIAGADDEHEAKEKLRAENKTLGIETAMNKAVKEAKNGKT